ncbi:MAG: SDR family NAD(P)-dependent oxidoreductase, partial [Candidatus Aureabacteria bacterium]|nr:SDR family NAD(P)-dependent oxidoreductase [Candidatus Auribacterota bacterium]
MMAWQQEDFSNVTVLVTGGSRGIGRAIALAFASRRARVAIAYVRAHEAARGVVQEIAARGGEGMAIACDARDWEAVRACVEQVTARFGQIDILVNCAGIVKDSLLSSMDVEDWRAVIDTNLTGAFYFMRAVAEGMVLQRAGRIINISSLSGTKGGKGQANYAASKAGLNALTRAAALELASRGITVNAVAPGIVSTEMSATIRGLAGDTLKKAIPVRRIAIPE